MEWLKRLLTILAIAAVSLAAVNGLCHYQDYEDPGLTTVEKGVLLGGPVVFPITFGVMTEFSYIEKKLYENWPLVDWYAFFLLLGYSLLLYQLIDIAFTLAPKAARVLGKWATASIILVCFFVFGSYFGLWQFTSLSILLSGASLCQIYLAIPTEGKNSQRSWLKQAMNGLCFTYAALLRIEPAVLSIAIWFPLFLFTSFQSCDPKKCLRLVFPLVVVAILSLIVNTPISRSDKNYIEFRKYMFTTTDFGQNASLRLATARDSIIYQVFYESLLFDSVNINSAFFQRIGIVPKDKTPRSLPDYFRTVASISDKLHDAVYKILNYGIGTILLFIIVSFYGIYLFARYNLRWLTLYLLLQLWTIGLFLSITILMRFEVRVMGPMSLCFILQNLVLFVYFIPEKDKPTISKWESIAFLFLSVPLIQRDNMAVLKLRQSMIENETEISKLECLLQTKRQNFILMTDQPKGKRPFQHNFDVGTKKPFTLQLNTGFFIEQYESYMSSMFGTFQLAEIVKHLKDRKSDLLVVSTAHKIELLQKYFNVVCGIPISFREVQQVDSTDFVRNSDSDPLCIYQIN